MSKTIVHIYEKNGNYPAYQWDGKHIVCTISYCKVYEPYKKASRLFQIPQWKMIKQIEHIKLLKSQLSLQLL